MLQDRSGLNGLKRLNWLRRLKWLACVLVIGGSLVGQELPKDVCRIEEGKLVFRLDPKWNQQQINQVVRQFNLDSTLVAEILKGLPRVEVNGVVWDGRKIAEGLIELSKAAIQIGDVESPEIPIFLTDEWLKKTGTSLDQGPDYGINKFAKDGLFDYRDSLVTLKLSGYEWAEAVYISGTFNEWSTSATPMAKQPDGWTVTLKLGPGHYPYKYIVDGRWTIDPNNRNREDDLNGGTNSVFYCYNYRFKLNGYTDASRVILAGSFNGFNPNELEMIRNEGGWVLPIYLSTGTHSYKFIVDGRWMTDPANPVIRGDGRGNQNSFMSIGDTLMFRVHAFPKARQVELAGSFNNWQWGELIMEKRVEGWELPYVLAPGNHEYKYIVDGKWTPDPENPYTTGNDRYMNSIRVVEPTYTFVLKGFADAKEVIVTGTFNGWNESGYRMAKGEEGWIFPIHLEPGKYSYKFLVDRKWMIDPGNPLYEPNEHGTDNSVLWIQ